jgi:hypothetical protein
MRDVRARSDRPARRFALAAGSVAVGGLAVLITCAGPAFADTAPAPLPSAPSALPSPSPDLSGTVTDLSGTATTTLQPVTSATPAPQPSSVPTSVASRPASGSGGKTQQGGRTGALSGIVDRVRRAMAGDPTTDRTRYRSPAAASLPATALPDLPTMHGWGLPPAAAVRTPVVAPYTTLPAAPAGSAGPAELAQRALGDLSATSSPFRRILTIAATMILGLIGAGHLKSAQMRSRSGLSG